MQFQLRDPDKVGFIVVAGNAFTYDEPGPAEIDVESLPLDQRNQLLYNCRRGVLACSEPDKLVELCESVLPAAKAYVTPAERPVPAARPTSIQEVVDPIEEDLKELRALLREPIKAIQRRVHDLPIGRTRKLLELETKGKNRKGVKSYINEILAKHAESVLGSVGDEDAGDKLTITGIGQVGSKQVSDVVESELEQVVLNPLEDAEE